MKERPILMNAEMVRATMDGRKTQTRRPVKLKDGKNNRFGVPGKPYVMNIRDPRAMEFCPFGQPGDRIWVRETWQEFFDDEMMPLCPRGPRGRLGSPSTPDRLSYVFYRADGPLPVQPPLGRANWRPSIHMPRWASRITLKITDVRVERLQDITEDDAIAEGCPGEKGLVWGQGVEVQAPQEQYHHLWDSIYYPGIYKEPSPYKWDANPWVWVVEFRMVQP